MLQGVVVVKKACEHCYSKIIALLTYNLIKLHSSISLQAAIDMLSDPRSRFEEYSIEGCWRSYPVLEITLSK